VRLYVKYIFSICFAFVWLLVSIYLSVPWVQEISYYFGSFISWTIVTGISLIPGLAISFLGISLYIDSRPQYKKPKDKFPPISILIAAYNEEECIYQTLQSIYEQRYPSPFEIILVDDGSTDKTVEYVNLFNKNYNAKEIILITNEFNKGKALVLNQGLEICKYDLVVTIDADSILHKKSLENIISVMTESDEDYVAVAGTILCKNHKKSFMASLQYWDYLVGISSVKRIQSMYQGTLVAQGAFSIYKTKALKEINGWPNKIGEDIVLTWALLDKDHKIGHAENAICFTNVPETYLDFYKQRKRWSRGLVEAFFSHPNLLFKKRKSTFFIWYNLFFPFIDFIFLFVFVPGVLLALIFKFYLIAGIMTILQIPLAIIYNLTIYFIQRQSLKMEGVEIAKGMWLISFFYILIYQLIMTPATLDGYWSELRQKKKTWNDE
jgi:biofilm PGA synthesis N-glycosyltransferase PgaC